VLAHQGTIDKFLGDAVMAWFNAPLPQHDHALRAVQAALDMQASIERLHDSLPGEHQLSLAVGIHYGDAVLGLVGTEERLDYTAIGDSVNTAKRIQENAAPGQILISAHVLEQIGEAVRVRPVASIPLKGKSQPIQVYEVLGLA
jgi:class 3 adenylate cyclase